MDVQQSTPITTTNTVSSPTATSGHASRAGLRSMSYASGAASLSPSVQLKAGKGHDTLTHAELEIALHFYKTHKGQYSHKVAVRIQKEVGAFPDGLIGPKTTRAIADWQSAHGLSVDGIAGQHTLTSMFGEDIRVGADGPHHGNEDKPKDDAKDKGGGLDRPNGLSEIKKVFGEPGTNQVSVSMRCGPGGTMRKITCHEKLAGKLTAVFQDIFNAGKGDHIHSYDGCYVFRKKRNGKGYSTHSWGIAVDINASTNPMQSKSKMKVTHSQKEIAPFFEAHGFYWGAAFGDPLHFQYCTGY